MTNPTLNNGIDIIKIRSLEDNYNIQLLKLHPPLLIHNRQLRLVNNRSSGDFLVVYDFYFLWLIEGTTLKCEYLVHFCKRKIDYLPFAEAVSGDKLHINLSKTL